MRFSRGGIVLAGGRNRRAGRDKASLVLEGKTVLERIVETLWRVCDEVVVVTAARPRPGGGDRCVEEILAAFLAREGPLPGEAKRRVAVARDVFEGAGPLGGIYTGLLASRSPRCFAVGCDMPLVEPRVVEYLFRTAADVVVPVSDDSAGHIEPLHAVYSRACMPFMRRSIEAGDLRVRGFFDRVRVVEVPTAEIRRLDPLLRGFANVNTPEDYRAMVRLARPLAEV